MNEKPSANYSHTLPRQKGIENMKKEILTLSGITQDLKKNATANMSNAEKWRFSYIIPETLIALIVGIVLKNIWIGLLVFSFAAYHIVLYVRAYRNFKAQKKKITDTIDRKDISISVEKLSHIALETIYEPHNVGARGKATKTVTLFYFMSGSSWRVPDVAKHYAWSKDHYISSKGLKNISVSGDEFYYVSLQGHYGIAYIYPCKNFVLDCNLK